MQRARSENECLLHNINPGLGKEQEQALFFTEKAE